MTILDLNILYTKVNNKFNCYQVVDQQPNIINVLQIKDSKGISKRGNPVVFLFANLRDLLQGRVLAVMILNNANSHVFIFYFSLP